MFQFRFIILLRIIHPHSVKKPPQRTGVACAPWDQYNRQAEVVQFHWVPFLANPWSESSPVATISCREAGVMITWEGLNHCKVGSFVDMIWQYINLICTLIVTGLLHRVILSLQYQLPGLLQRNNPDRPLGSALFASRRCPPNRQWCWQTCWG